jgi:DNA-binding CsgD family transcriptional regulator
MKSIPEIFASICIAVSCNSPHFVLIIITVKAKTAANGQASATAPVNPTPADLSPREKEIFDLLLAGKDPKTIGFDLNIAYQTVISHQKSLYKKLGVHSIQELFAKYKLGYTPPPKRPLPKKLIIAAGAAVIAVAVTVLSVSERNKNKDFIAVIDLWNSAFDRTSESYVSVGEEIINGKTETCVTVTGRTNTGGIGTYAGAVGSPTGKSLDALKTATSISFKVLGDGGRYDLRLPTAETMDGDHWLSVFQTVKDEIVSVEVNIPDDLLRAGWTGVDVPFVQESIVYLMLQQIDPGDFCIKAWGFRFVQRKGNKNSLNNGTTNWYGIGEAGSQTLVSRATETINGTEALTVTFSGVLNPDNISVSGVFGRPDQRTLETIRTSMTSLSFQYTGDGNRYGICLLTSGNVGYYYPRDALFTESDPFMKVLQTVPGEISAVTIQIPGDLTRGGSSGADTEFNRGVISSLQILPLDPGGYQFKFWDMTLK